MASTKFYLDMRGKAKDGKGSVVIIIYHNATSTSIATGIRLLPSNWKNQTVVNLTGAEALNASLQERKLKIDKDIALLSLNESIDRLSASDIKKQIETGKVRKPQGHLVSELFDEYINNGNLKEGTKEIYRSTLRKVIAFGGEQLKIENVDLRWVRGFDKFLAKTQEINGRAIYMRDLRAICNYARHIGIEFSYPFFNFHIKQEETKKRSITLSNLQTFYKYPTSADKQVYRDYFFLMFYLIGINSVDLLTAKKSQVINGRLEYNRQKTGKHYSIKIEPEAEVLLKKYEGKGDYLLEALDHCKYYRSFAHEMNDALKLIGPTIEEVELIDDLFAEPKITKRIEPIIPKISTYFARHTWSTLAHELDISSDIIAQALGHTNTNRVTMIYIKPNQEKVDEANRKVIDFLLGK